MLCGDFVKNNIKVHTKGRGQTGRGAKIPKGAIFFIPLQPFLFRKNNLTFSSEKLHL
jgi:hypothetical protein